MKNSEPISVAEANAMSSLALAHVGDAVYELLVRSMLAARGPAAVYDLHRQTVAYVRAEAQAETVKRLLPLLTEEETAVYKRGRNSRVHGVPAHANPGEYHTASTESLPMQTPASTTARRAWKPCSAGSISQAGRTGSGRCSTL